MKQSQQGFSLIELLLVLAILSIILGIATPIYADILEGARYTADRYTIAMIQRAESFYSILNNTHSFDTRMAQNTDLFVQSIEKLKNGYIDEVVFQSIENPRWERTKAGWIIAYDLPPKLQEKNNPAAWDPNKTYRSEDCVLYKDVIYQARETNKGLIPGLFGSPWQEITSEWRAFNVYQPGDLVTYGTYIYEALVPSEGKSPLETDYWKKLDT